MRKNSQIYRDRSVAAQFLHPGQSDNTVRRTAPNGYSHCCRGTTGVTLLHVSFFENLIVLTETYRANPCLPLTFFDIVIVKLLSRDLGKI